MRFTNAAHIVELISQGEVSTLPLEVSGLFLDTLEQFPLRKPVQASVDWSEVPNHQLLPWYEQSDDEVLNWAKRLRIGEYQHVGVWYCSTEPCLLTTFEFAMRNLDTLTWGSPGPRYCFGIRVSDTGLMYDFGALLEVDGGPLIHGVANSPSG